VKVLGRCRGEKCGETVWTCTLRKTVDKKVRPVNNHPADGSVPEGDPLWYDKRFAAAKEKMKFGSRYDSITYPRFCDKTPGFRLTPERLEAIREKIGIPLTDEEFELFAQVLQNREAALAWDFSECGRVHDDVVPPQVIRTIEHSAWQTKSVPVPKALMPKVVEELNRRLERGILEESHDSYRNNWFVILKKDGSLRLINDAQRANKVTIRDAHMPPEAEEFSEEIAACILKTLMDLFSGYDQITLHPQSRPLTTFQTPIGLFRLTTLPMGGTNSVAQFQRAMLRIFATLIPHVCRVYVDDIAVKGPTSDYGGEEMFPGVRRFVAEHFRNIDRVLLNAELAGATISGKKTQWCCREAVLLGYLLTPDGRKPAEDKVRKINEWLTCRQVEDVRKFLGLCGFYRVWIRGFAVIAGPLYNLTRKNAEWRWGEEEQRAMDTLKAAITSAPILAPLIYDDPRYGEIFLMTDASLDGWGGVLEQVGPDKKRHPCRFESGIWSNSEKNYDPGKRELRGLLYLLKRFKRYLFGVHFTVETDALVLVHQLNGAARDLPGALMMRWITWIRMFDFEVKHVPGTKNPVADALSRKPPGPSDLLEKVTEEDIDDYIDAQIYTSGADESMLDPNLYSEESQRIAHYLLTLQEPTHIKEHWKRRRWKQRALNFIVRDRHLYLRPRSEEEDAEPRRVVDTPEERRRVFDACHREMGHRGRDATYRRVTRRYWWKGIYGDVEKWIANCPECQYHDKRRFPEAAQFAVPPNTVAVKWHIDVQYMPAPRGRKRPLLEARDDLSSWVEARPANDTKSKTVAQFIYECIILRWGVPLEVVVDGGPEFRGEVAKHLAHWGVRRVVISPYNSRANGVVEAGHVEIAEPLTKLTEGTGQKWETLLP
jgi:hypothetical protein